MKQDSPYLSTLLQTATRKLMRQFEAQTADHGLSAAQWRLLGHLLKQGPSTQVALAELLDVEPISVSRLIDRMEQGGWLRREAHPDDRRARIIVASDKARATAPGVKAIAEALTMQAMDGLTEDERRIFLSALRRVAENMDKLNSAQGAAAEPEFEKTT